MFLTVVKALSELACVVGSEVIVGGIVKNTVNPSTNRILNTCSKVATVCVAGVLGAAASEYADRMIDETADLAKKVMKKEAAHGPAQEQS